MLTFLSPAGDQTRPRRVNASSNSIPSVSTSPMSLPITGSIPSVLRYARSIRSLPRPLVLTPRTETLTGQIERGRTTHSSSSPPSTYLPRCVPTNDFFEEPSSTSRRNVSNAGGQAFGSLRRRYVSRAGELRSPGIEARSLDESIVSQSLFFVLDYEGYSPSLCVRRSRATRPFASLARTVLRSTSSIGHPKVDCRRRRDVSNAGDLRSLFVANACLRALSSTFFLAVPPFLPSPSPRSRRETCVQTTTKRRR